MTISILDRNYIRSEEITRVNSPGRNKNHKHNRTADLQNT